MKSFLAVLLILGGAANFALADRILIYQGTVVGRSVHSGGADSFTFHAYEVFDLDSLMFSQIYYGGTGKDKKALVQNTEAFVYGPVMTSAKTSSSYFGVTPSSTADEGFHLSYTAFSGANHLLNLGGTFTGLYPTKLALTSRFLTGQGTTDSDSTSMQSGAFTLSLTLTQKSNMTDDDFDAAVSVVTDFLANKGYTIIGLPD